MSKSILRLSSGKRINSAEDGVADLAQITRLDGQYRGITQAIRNVNDTQALATTASSSLDSLLTLTYNLRDLAQQAQSSSLTDAERQTLIDEADGLLADYSTIVNNTSYNDTNLLDNTFGTTWAQTGPNADNGFFYTIGDARSSTLGKLAIYSGAQGSISAPIVGQVTFNGVTVESSVDDGVSTSGGAYSALAIANALSASTPDTGVYAEAVSTTRTITTDFAGASVYSGTFGTGNFKINNVSITGAISSASSLVSYINAASDSTGVTATLSGSDVTLTASDGRNIEVYFSAAGLTHNVYDVFNLSANTAVITNYATLSQGADKVHIGAVRIWSSSAITIAGTAPSAALGIASGTKNLVSGTELESLSLSSEDNSDQALKVLDATIAQISTLRSEIGAIHDRLDVTASFLLDQQNATADAKSAIEDVDLALETVNLVVAQLLQNSGTAALSQANLSLSNVTKLLENL